ncbi:MAG: U32 family peptidase, partial [Myxococcota bacterium]|nr:U32 family peptidase [Myxococcota bacterium]
MKRRPEILAPAGDEASLNAAINAGADAVYFGLDGIFNARAKAAGFSIERLPEIAARCRRARVRSYLTLNTLVFDQELPHLESLLREIASAGIDALIVQDPAVARLAQEICPALELHASTQMTISSPEGAAFAEALGCRRAVLPRELSLKEIERFTAESSIEIEVFIHGALCMSWSGQCLTSEAWGGRSANRGKCAQSCRLPYTLVVDEEERPLPEGLSYLLSPRDLAGFRAVEGLTEIGVHSLKIEGRYKGPSYVQSAVSSYRRWLDALERGVEHQDEAQLGLDLQAMSLSYSRGFSDGFFGGRDHQSLVEGYAPKHQGLFLGVVEAVEDARSVIVRVLPSPREELLTRAAEAEGKLRVSLPALGADSEAATGPGISAPIPRAGLGVRFDQGRPEEEEPGGALLDAERLRPRASTRNTEAALDEARWRLRFPWESNPVDRARVGDRVWLTGDP